MISLQAKLYCTYPFPHSGVCKKSVGAALVLDLDWLNEEKVLVFREINLMPGLGWWVNGTDVFCPEHSKAVKP